MKQNEEYCFKMTKCRKEEFIQTKNIDTSIIQVITLLLDC